MPEDAFLFAGEHVLGVLEGQEDAEARRFLLRDARFADAVAWWERQLGAMGEAFDEQQPSDRVWRAIEARISAQNDNQVGTGAASQAPVSRLSIAALVTGAGLAVASLLLFLATPARTPQVPATPVASGPQLIAQIADEQAERRIASVIDRNRNRLSLRIEGLSAAPGEAPELWVIPQGAAPVSLGAIPEAGTFERDLTGEESRLLVAGSSLAVTFEDDTGQPHEAPTPPILLVGALDEV